MYAQALADRADRLIKLRAKPENWAALKVFYREHPVEFINDWGVTFDPRNADIGLPALMPFTLFPKQVECIEWLYARWKVREDGLIDKSRDMGVSWLCVAFGVWMWSFYPQSVIGFGSRKEEYVDASGDPKSLFWKVREYIDYLPIELRPAGYERKAHANYMRIVNPDNGAVIVGEAGDNIGRGNRTSIYFKDESAYMERPELIDAALSQTSNCKIDVSTPNGAGNPFYRKRHGGKIPVFTLHWRDDPRKGIDWYNKQAEKLDPVILAQEVDIDYNASTADSWINGALVEAAQRNGPADVVANGPWMIGVDAAHMGDDESIIQGRRGAFNADPIIRKKIDGIQLAALVVDHCDDLVEAGGTIGMICVELDGPGVSCYDQLKAGKYKNKVVGIHTGTRLTDGRNYNVKARLWRRALDYIKVDGRCMPRDPEIKTQIAAVRYSYRDGLLLMESKKDHKKRLGKSPDRADAWILTFADMPEEDDRRVEVIPVRNHWNQGARL